MSKHPADLTPTSNLRSLPQVEEVLRHTLVAQLEASIARPVIVDAIRQSIADMRILLLENSERITTLDEIAGQAFLRAILQSRPSLRRVINATGIILHTNLGRSVLPKQAADAVASVAQGYSTLEYNVDALARGSRHDHCERLLCVLTGAEAAIAVNNNAAAVLMVLSEFARNKEAVVSRGELIEIGGAFRIPDIMDLSGATMIGVGTTNKTHRYDYERATTDETALYLKVHTSNYQIVGFTESVSAREITRVANSFNEARRANNLPEILVYEDLGSGCLIDLSRYGLPHEPTVKEALAQGCDLVSFSGDKLLGSAQAGIIVGSKKLIDRLKKNPFARAMRLDKMTLAALETTLRLYLDPDRAVAEIPTLHMLCAPAEEIHDQAKLMYSCLTTTLAESLSKDVSHYTELSLVEEVGYAGGGSLPGCELTSWAVALSFNCGTALDCERFLVQQTPNPIIAHIKHECLLLDARTILSKDEMLEIAQGIAQYFASL